MNQRENSKVEAILANARWVLPVVLWVAVAFTAGEFIYKVEQRSLFIFDAFWLKDLLLKPAGILSGVGLFLTQFLHIPWLGSLVWVLLLVASAELTRKVYNVPAGLSALTYIPAAVFAAYNMSLGYIVYLTNLPGFFFMPVLGYLWALLTVAVLRRADKTAMRAVLFAVWGLAGYYIAGFYGLAGIVAAFADLLCSEGKRMSKVLCGAVTAAVTVLAPVIFVGLTTYNLRNGWIMGMPEPDYGLTAARMVLPLVIAMFLPVILPFLDFLRVLHPKSDTFLDIIIMGALMIAMVAAPAALWFRDDNFKAELGMIHAVDDMEWNKAVGILDKLQSKHEKDEEWQPTRVLVLLKDLALIKTGQEGERIYGFDNGCKPQKTKCDVPMAFQIGKVLHLNYGIPGICNRWCSEESVLFGWNYMTLRYYAMVAILLNDPELTDKYLDKLEKTMFYRKWAKAQRKLCADRELLAKTAPYDQILQLMCYDDLVCSDSEGCEVFLTNHFNGPLPKNQTPLYSRVALFYAMESKQSTLFWTRFFNYLDVCNPEKIDRYYQEAAYLFSNVENNEMLEALPFSEKTKSLYKAFMQSATRVGMKSLEEARMALQPTLRHTYYYYFYYVNELQMF